jgi:Putative RNA methylase family UPF0020
MPGLPVLDPMCGSGTTLVEANVSGYSAIGTDLNPIAVLAARAKTMRTTEFDRAELAMLCDRLDRGTASLPFATPPGFTNRDKWFTAHVQRELAASLAAIDQLTSETARVMALACLSAIVVPVSNQESETRWCATHNPIEPGETISRLARKVRKSVSSSEDFSSGAIADSLVVRTDARNLPLRDGSVGLVVTSPPYANSHDYYLYNKLRMFWLGFDVTPVQDAEIGSRNRHSDRKAGVDHYLDAMSAILGETRRVLAPGARAVFVVADSVIRKQFYDMGELFTGLGGQVGFDVEAVFNFAHKKFNSTFQSNFGTDRPKLTHVIVYRN